MLDLDANPPPLTCCRIARTWWLVTERGLNLLYLHSLTDIALEAYFDSHVDHLAREARDRAAHRLFHQGLTQ